jgi:Sec-independent protein translocase protein TatA
VHSRAAGNSKDRQPGLPGIGGEPGRLVKRLKKHQKNILVAVENLPYKPCKDLPGVKREYPQFSSTLFSFIRPFQISVKETENEKETTKSIGTRRSKDAHQTTRPRRMSNKEQKTNTNEKITHTQGNKTQKNL